MVGRQNSIRKPCRSLRPWMRLVHVAALATHEVEHLLRVGHAVDRAVFRVRRHERAVLRTIHEPVHGLWKDERPVPTEVHVGFLGRNQQEIRIRLRAQRGKVRVQLVETQIGEIVRVPVAVKVHDHRRVDAHRLQHRLERRRPVGAVGDRLNGVGEMPVRAERLVSVEGAKAIAVRVAKHVCKRRFRRGARQQKEHAHALRPSWRRVHPGVELPIFIPELADAQRHAPAERAMPDEAQIGREVAREEVCVRRGKHRHAAAGRLQRQRAIARLHGHALGLQPVQRDTPQRAVGVVVDGLGAHVVARLTIGGRGHVESGVVVVRDVGSRTLSGPLPAESTGCPGRTCKPDRRRSCPCAGRRRQSPLVRQRCAPWRHEAEMCSARGAFRQDATPDRRRRRTTRLGACQSRLDRRAARRGRRLRRLVRWT